MMILYLLNVWKRLWVVEERGQIHVQGITIIIDHTSFKYKANMSFMTTNCFKILFDQSLESLLLVLLTGPHFCTPEPGYPHASHLSFHLCVV